MTCAEFDHLCDDDNGRDINDYTDAEILAMSKHMLACPRCITKAMLEAAAFERHHTPQEVQANEAQSEAIFNRILPRLATDPEL